MNTFTKMFRQVGFNQDLLIKLHCSMAGQLTCEISISTWLVYTTVIQSVADTIMIMKYLSQKFIEG